MTDRELLEAAANAAGMPNTGELYALGLKLLDGPHNYWNPLANDDQALRLAVDLSILIAPDLGITLAGPEIFKGEVLEDHGTDPYAATRRAIVRAAAAMVA